MNGVFYVTVDERGVVLNVGCSDRVPQGAVAVTPEDAMRVQPGAMLREGRVVAPAVPAPSMDHVLDAAGRWVLPEHLAWAQVRRERNQRLAACDWVVTRAQEWGEPVPQEWLTYRQALRDVTQQGNPQAIVWPVAPNQAR